MEQDINNKLDNILESSLRGSLMQRPHTDFAKNLMLKISLEEEFEKQDVKTEKFAKKIILSISGVLVAMVSFILYVVYSSPSADENSGVIAQKTTSFFEIYSIKVLNLLGLNGGGSILLVLSVVVIVTLFLTVDKLILKKK